MHDVTCRAYQGGICETSINEHVMLLDAGTVLHEMDGGVTVSGHMTGL